MQRPLLPSSQPRTDLASRRHGPLHRIAASASLAAVTLTVATACVTTQTEPTDLLVDSPQAPASSLAPQVASIIVLNQLDVEFDGDAHPDSPWGEAIVEYTGTGNVLYFNLAVDGNWRIQNVPLLSRQGSGVLQTDALAFDLGVADGTDVTSVDAAWDLTAGTLNQMPAAAAVVTPTGARSFAISSGFRRKEIGFVLPSPALVGGAADGPKATNRDFPNQEAGRNECVPAALSNSLQWLNAQYGLGLNAGDISIAAMKVLVKWNAGGAPQQWWSRKRRHFKDDITTTTIPKTSLSKVFDAVAQGCDVEMRANNHVVAVTAAQKLANGDYRLDLTHDTVQGNDSQGTGAQGTQSVVWDRKTKKFSGAPWIEGRRPDLFVSECSKRRT